MYIKVSIINSNEKGKGYGFHLWQQLQDIGIVVLELDLSSRL